ncbi:hypothetical protein HKD37_15G044215 [Glycine soja]
MILGKSKANMPPQSKFSDYTLLIESQGRVLEEACSNKSQLRIDLHLEQTSPSTVNITGSLITTLKILIQNGHLQKFFKGPSRIGSSNLACKHYVHSLKFVNLIAVEKRVTRSLPPITSTDEDFEGIETPSLNELGAIILNSHLAMKFPSEDGKIIIAKANQMTISECYAGSLRITKRKKVAESKVQLVVCTPLNNNVGEAEIDPREAH